MIKSNESMKMYPQKWFRCQKNKKYLQKVVGDKKYVIRPITENI